MDNKEIKDLNAEILKYKKINARNKWIIIAQLIALLFLGAMIVYIRF